MLSTSVPSATLDTALLVFAKAPVAGQVKTRLSPPLTPEEAARLHRTLVCRTLTNARGVPGIRPRLYCAPDTGHPFFQACAARFQVTLWLQRGADLGARMGQALREALTDHRSALLVGCDCPDLGPVLLERARAALIHRDAVLGPALDGGYVLLGLSRYLPGLFQDIPWGGDRVLAISRQRLRQAGLDWHELSPLRDLDRPEDLAQYPDLDPRLNPDQGAFP